MDIECTTRGLLAVFFRQKARFFLVFGLIVLAGLGYILTAKPIYEAQGSLIVRFGQNAQPSLSPADNRTVSEVARNDRTEMMQSQTEILRSNSLLNDAITAYGLDRLYPDLDPSAASPLQLAIYKMQRDDLIIKPESNSNLIQVYLRNKDPKVAEVFAKLLLEKFLQRQSEVFNATQTDFLRQQVTEAKQQLDLAQRAIQSFKQEAGVGDLNVELEQLQAEKKELSGLAFKAVTDAQTALSELEGKEAEMRTTYRPNNPALLRLQGNIAVAREEVRKRQEDLLSAKQEDNGTFSAKIKAIDTRLNYLEDQRSKYDELLQRVELGIANYKFYQQRSEEARVNSMLNQQNITRVLVVDPPHALSRPVHPRKMLLLAITLMAAMMAALGVALALELLDERFTTPEQLERKLALPVLASFSTTQKA